MTQRLAPIPEGLDILQDGGAVVIRRAWFSHVVWFLILFCIAWDGGLIFFYKLLLSAVGGGSGSPPAFFLLFPLIHVAVGVGLTYFVICMFVNKTDVILRPEALTIRTHPLPWPGNHAIPAADLVSFSVRERVTGGEDRRTAYDLMYVNSSNREKSLIKSLSKREEADYLSMALTWFYFPNETANIPGVSVGDV